MMMTEPVTGFVLHSINYQNTSVILTLFTRELGLVKAIAQGIKRPKSALPGLLQPFTPLWFYLTGKNELKKLSKAESNGVPFKLRGIDCYSGFYLNELLIRLLHNEPDELVYQAYIHCLADPNNINLREFELKLLSELGYLPPELQEPDLLDNKTHYQFIPDVGLQSANIGITGEILKNIANKNWQSLQTQQAAKHLCRTMLDAHLGGRPLRTREFMGQL